MSELLTISYWIDPAVDSDGSLERFLLFISVLLFVIGLLPALFPLKKILVDQKPLISFLRRVGKHILSFGILLSILFILREYSLGIFSTRVILLIFGMSFALIIVADIRHLVVKLPSKMRFHEEAHKKRIYLPRKSKKRSR